MRAGGPSSTSSRTISRDKRMLLVLDNFEQIVDGAAPQMAELLTAAERVKILVTSRFLLRISAEREFVVPPLSPPSGDLLTSFENLKRNEGSAAVSRRGRRRLILISNSLLKMEEQSLEVSHGSKVYRSRSTRWPREPASFRPRPYSRSSKPSSQFLTGGRAICPNGRQTMQGAIDWSYRPVE